MSDLVEFLKVRLDEDYEAARLVLGVNVMVGLQRGKAAPRWVPSPEGDAGIWDTDGIPRVKFVWVRERDHIIRHDPARVLAEVEAKRRRLARHTPTDDPLHGRLCSHCSVVQVSVYQAWPCPDILDDAAVYADHPDYREGWRP